MLDQSGGAPSSARLAGSLSNPSGLLIRLIEAVAEGDNTATLQVKPVEDPAIAMQIKENRILSPDEVAELVEEYRRGAALRDLSRRFGVHRATVDRHLERVGVAKRPQVKMTPDRVARAAELHGQLATPHPPNTAPAPSASLQVPPPPAATHTA